MSTDPLATTDGGIPPPPRLPDYSPTPLRYQLLRLHAKGALGEVHVAHDRELGREVALKLMQAHVADHPDLRKRFLLEAEVTGNLEHPGIVPVYGLGVDDKGRAYYAMRLIKGESLLEAIAHFHAAGGDHSQTIRHLMGRFVAVCQAVAYAHSRGILHRDLKPANVMLGPYGETLVVDWGLARPVARSEGDRSLGEDTLTPRPDHQPGATRGVVGSPAYMSPEQAGGLHSQVGPASDVYGLGATLYALLTGEPPFAGTTLDEVLEKVQRGEFLRPRLRNKAVPPALEAVCLKAMALRREDRYPNAADLGRDVEAWLADEPVSAWKEPLSERLRRWVKRRRTAVASTLAAGAVALVVMTAATLLLRTAYVKESDARGDAERESKRAERGLQVAQETNATLLELAEELKPAPGLQVRVLDRVLGRASRRYDELRRVAGDRADVREGKARVLIRLSEARVLLGDTTTALAAATEAEKLYRRLLQDEPGEPRLRAGLASAIESVAAVQPLQGRLREALSAHREARDLRAALVADFPEESRWRLDLAMSHYRIGNILNEEGDVLTGEREHRRAFKLRRDVAEREPNNREARARLASSHLKLGDADWEHWERRSSLGHYARAVGLLDGLLADDPNHNDWRRLRTEAALSLGQAHQHFNQGKEALAQFEPCLAAAEQFAGLDPTHAEWQRVLLDARRATATLRHRGNPDARLRAFAATYRELLPVAESRARLDPANVEWQAQLATMRRSLASTVLSLALRGAETEANLAEAGRMLDAAEAVLAPLARQHPDHLALMTGLGGVREFQARLRRARREPGASSATPAPELEHFERRRRSDPDNLSWLWQLATLNRAQRHPAGDLLFDTTRTGRAVALAEELRQREPENLRWLDLLTWALDDRANVVNLLSQYLASDRHRDDVTASWKAHLGSPLYAEYQAREWTSLLTREKLAYLRAGSPDALRDLADAWRKHADDRRGRGQAAAAQAAYQKHLAALEHLHRLFPAELARDPFDRPDAHVSYDIARARHPGLLASKRSLVDSFNVEVWDNPRSSTANELLHRLIELFRELDASKPAEAAEARWGLRRGVALLVSEGSRSPLPRPLASLIPFFEKRLAALPAPKREVAVGGKAQLALEYMQYNLLTQELAGRPRDLVLLLAQEARDAAPVPWAASELRRRALLALLRDPDNVPNVLRAAREAAAETPDRLGSEGRAFFALLAVCAGDGDAARRLHEPTARTGVESRLAQSLARELSIFGNVLARVGKTDQARSIWRTALGLCPEKPEAAGKLRKALQQKLAEPPKAP